MTDFAKLVLIETCFGKPCRKLFVVTDPEAVSHLANSWHGRFAREYGIEVLVISIDNSLRQTIVDAQNRQYR
jgi:hypothetical protein